MIDNWLHVALILLSVSLLGCLYRLLKGPSLADRIAALDTMGISTLAIIAVIGLLLRTQAYVEVILLIGILTFIGTTALARFIERGVVMEHGDDQRDR